MNELSYLNDLKEDLEKLDKFWVVVYGSYLSNYFIPQRSDIDIAIISQIQDKKENIAIRKKYLGEFSEKYDIKIFELLPLFIKMEIINNYSVLYGNPLDISEYFYHFRSIWKDMTYRIESNRFKNLTEKIKILEGRHIWKERYLTLYPNANL